jgi:hypothetical protein
MANMGEFLRLNQPSVIVAGQEALVNLAPNSGTLGVAPQGLNEATPSASRIASDLPNGAVALDCAHIAS